MTDSKPIIVALDFPNAESAMALADKLDPNGCRVKVGKELFTHAGPGLVGDLVRKGFDVFLDLKYHDIPNTVGRACAVAADLGVWMVNVHASGGRKMIEAAHEAFTLMVDAPKLIAVTVLTSMDRTDLKEVGLDLEPIDQVVRLAKLAKASGADGVVCSPKEVEVLRGELGSDFGLVTPGIRPAGSDQGDQKRITTPADAVRMGSDWLVIGRPITAAPDPLAALNAINAEIAAV